LRSDERIREQVNSEWNATVEQMETEIRRLREAIRHVVDDSPGTPDSVKRFLSRAVLDSFPTPDVRP
jgi:hypothetical protein